MEQKLKDMIADLRLNGWASEITESMEKLLLSIGQHIDGLLSPAEPEPTPSVDASARQPGDPEF